MKFKAAAAILLSLLYWLTSSLNLTGVDASNEQLTPQKVLLLYDSMANDTSKAGNVELLQRQLASFGMEVTLLAEDFYSKGLLDQFNWLILIKNSAEIRTINESFERDLAAFEGHLLQIGGVLSPPLKKKLPVDVEFTKSKQNVVIAMSGLQEEVAPVQNAAYIHVNREAGQSVESYGTLSPVNSDSENMPFAVKNNNAAYAPLYEKGNLSELAMLYVLKEWLGTTGDGKLYLLFKEIYPFSDLDLLAKAADELYEAGIPFIASVRPVLDNFDYPAMFRYMEALKHIQSRNGSIVINTPVISSTTRDTTEILGYKLTSFINALGDYGVVPLGMGAELYWSYDKEYVNNGMAFFDSVILFPNQLIMHRSQSNVSQTFASALYSVSPEEWNTFLSQRKVWADIPTDIALTVDFPENEQELEDMVSFINDQWLVFSDYKLARHEVITERFTMVSGNGLMINGKGQILNDTERIVDSDFQYVEEDEVSFSKLFSIQNRIFIFIICLALLLFGILFVLGYRLYKRKYLK